MSRLTRRERWTLILRALGSLERLVDAAAEDKAHPDHDICEGCAADAVHMATSMANYAVDGDFGVDPPPRGACRENWRDANLYLQGVTAPDLIEAIRTVRLAMKGKLPVGHFS